MIGKRKSFFFLHDRGKKIFLLNYHVVPRGKISTKDMLLKINLSLQVRLYVPEGESADYLLVHCG